MRAMILAAGLGTRLRPLTDHVPKALVPVGLEPGILRWLRWLHGQGVSDVVVNLHHHGHSVRAVVEGSPPAGIRVIWSEEPEILGTGGGIRKALEHLGPDPFLVVNVDVVTNPDVAALRSAHLRLGATATMLLREDPDAARYGAVEVDAEGRVRRLLGEPAQPKAPLRPCVFTGVQLLSPDVAGLLPERGCVVRSLYRRLVAGEGTVAGVLTGSPWFDIGSVEGYLAANFALAGGRVLAAPDALIEPGAVVEPPVVLGPRARVRAGAMVRRAVVWQDAVVDGTVEDAVVTPWGCATSSRASGPGSR